MLAGNHLRLTAVQRMFGVDHDMLNVFYFKVTAVTGTFVLNDMSGDLESWFINDFIDKIVDIQTASLIYNSALFESMENWTTEFVNVAFTTPPTGTVASEYGSSGVALSFELVRTSRITRNGGKRFGGVPESYVSQNTVVGAGVAAVAAVAADLAATWIIDAGGGNTMTIAPVIAKTPVPPATLPSVYNDVSDAVFRRVGSQNSRKNS